MCFIVFVVLGKFPVFSESGYRKNPVKFRKYTITGYNAKLSEITGHFQAQMPLRFRAAQFETIVGPYTQVCKKKSVYFVVFGKGDYRLWAPDKPEVAVMQSKVISDVRKSPSPANE